MGTRVYDMTGGEQPLICPTCVVRPASYGLSNKIGGNREGCRTCNAYNQRVVRLTTKRLAERFPEDYEEIKQQARLDVYAALRKPVTDLKGIKL